MVIEYPQMLSAAHLVLDGFLIYRLRKTKAGQWRRTKQYLTANQELNHNLYLPTHINHPSSRWVRQSRANYEWLFNMWVSLLDEYEYRFGFRPKPSDLELYLKTPPANITQKRIMTDPPIAIKDRWIHMSSAIDSYRNFYNLEKSAFATWTRRPAPFWYSPGASYGFAL